MLHIDEFASEARRPAGWHPKADLSAVEGWNRFILRANVGKMFSWGEKVPMMFLLLAWLVHTVDDVQPYFWEQRRAWFVNFNAIFDPKNYIYCQPTNNTHGLPSLLRMTVLHGFASAYWRPAVLCAGTMRAFLTLFVVCKWRHAVRGRGTRCMEAVALLLTVLEVLLLHTFAVSNNPQWDSVAVIKVSGVLFWATAVANQALFVHIVSQMFAASRDRVLVLGALAVVFASSVPKVLEGHFGFVEVPLCSPVVGVTAFVLEVTAMTAYVLFYAHLRTLLHDVEFVVFASQKSAQDQGRLPSRRQSSMRVSSI